MKYSRLIGSAALILGLAFCLPGCERDEFAEAPRASAATAKPAGAAGAGSGDGSLSGRLGPVEGTTLPDGHPPLGGSGGGQGAEVPAPDIERASIEEYGKVGPIRWEAPERWEAHLPANQMRFAQYGVPGEVGQEPAELVVFYFGPGGGGGVDENLQRWAGQLTGGPEPVFGTDVVNGMNVHTLDASGNYDAGAAAVGASPRGEQRMLAAIVETSAGLFFFRLLGAKPVIDKEEAAFKEFIQTFQPG